MGEAHLRGCGSDSLIGHSLGTLRRWAGAPRLVFPKSPGDEKGLLLLSSAPALVSALYQLTRLVKASALRPSRAGVASRSVPRFPKLLVQLSCRVAIEASAEWVAAGRCIRVLLNRIAPGASSPRNTLRLRQYSGDSGLAEKLLVKEFGLMI